MKLSGPRAFRLVVTTMVAVVVAPFFAAIIIATWSEIGGAARDVVDMVWWSRWSELDGAARDVVDVVWWSELGGAARDVVDVVWRQLDVGSDGSLSVHLMSESPKKSSRCISRIDVVQVPNS